MIWDYILQNQEWTDFTFPSSGLQTAAQEAPWKLVGRAERVTPEPPILFPLEQLCFIYYKY